MKDPKIEELSCLIGEGIHNGLRKIGESKEAADAYYLISTMPDDEWNAIVKRVAVEVHKRITE
jgi:hypothetical protein